jgi:hypothetical protein
MGAGIEPDIGAEVIPEGKATEALAPIPPPKFSPADCPPDAFKGSCWALAFIKPRVMVQTEAPSETPRTAPNAETTEARKAGKRLLSNFIN